MTFTIYFLFDTTDRYYGPTNKGGLDIIKEFVRWFPTFYTDLVGVRTIGYGHGESLVYTSIKV